MRRQRRDAAQRALEHLDAEEQRHPEGGHLPPRLPESPHARLPKVSQVDEQPRADRGRSADHHDHGQRASEERMLGAHEEPRGDDLGAEEHAIEVHLADAGHGHRGDDRDLQSRRVSRATRGAALQGGEQPGRAAQHDLEPLDHVILADEAAAERWIAHGNREEHDEHDEAQDRGDGPAAGTTARGSRRRQHATPGRGCGGASAARHLRTTGGSCHTPMSSRKPPIAACTSARCVRLGK
jgi:hypothetical protein